MCDWILGFIVIIFIEDVMWFCFVVFCVFWVDNDNDDDEIVF